MIIDIKNKEKQKIIMVITENPKKRYFDIYKLGVDWIVIEYDMSHGNVRKNEILNVQERARFNGMPSHDFSEVARVQLANINLMYKLGTLKLPKMIKKYRNGRVIEQQSVFNSVDTVDGVMGKMIRMTPSWDNDTPELDTYGDGYGEQVPLPPINYDNFLDELP